MIAQFDSQDLQFRSPFGAVPLGTAMQFRIKVETNDKTYCMLRYRLSNSPDQEHLIPMERKCEEGALSVFGCRLEVPEHPCLIWYDFVIRADEEYWYISNAEDCLGGKGILTREPIAPFQATVYREMNGNTEWFSEGVMYQIFIDRFNKGTQAGRYTRPALIHSDWRDSPHYVKDEKGRILRYDFFGGTLNGVREKLDYLKEFGVTILYLNPIFESASNHKYDTADYLKIDPNFGDEEDLVALCKEAEERGIAVILDGVFSHVGSDSRYFNREGFYDDLGAYQSKESPYYPWFRFDQHPNEYESWWGIDTMPNVNEEDESYQSFILKPETGVLSHWMKSGISGWRLDVADELPDSFIKGIQHRVKEENSNGIVIGEVWEDASNKVSYETQREYLFGDELDSVMNYPFREGIIRFLRKEETGILFMRKIRSLQENYPKKTFYQLMNFLGTHDTMRILNALIYPDEPIADKSELMIRMLSKEEGQLAMERLKMAVMLLFALPGTPCIYYGDEAGLEGWKDPYNRGTYPWGDENAAVMEVYREWSHRYHTHSALRKGEFIDCETTERSISFLRRWKEETLYCIINAGDDSINGYFPEPGQWESISTGHRFERIFEIEGKSGEIFIKREG